MTPMRLPLWLKILWTIWVLVWIPIYWHQYGAQNFLYFCDIGNILIAVALWLESPLIFSWQAVGLLLFQTLFVIDLVGALISGKHFVGATGYMFDPHVPLLVRMLSLFHVVTPPLLLWAIWRLGYDKRGWKYETVMTWIVIPINYLWRPQFNVNWARGLFFQEQHLVPGPVYLLIYLVAVPLVVYWPTHRFLIWFDARRGNHPHSGGAQHR
ncbi:MAG TPA: hypothetical protein VFB28_09185 [Terriglobales bacterium]|nr:hypothetical protein [Terriglobales bacterium]